MISTPSSISQSTIFEEQSTICQKLSAGVGSKLTLNEAERAAQSIRHSFDNWDVVPLPWSNQLEFLSSDFEWFESGMNYGALDEDLSDDPELGKRASEKLDTEVCSLATPVKKTSSCSHFIKMSHKSGSSTPIFELSDIEN